MNGTSNRSSAFSERPGQVRTGRGQGGECARERRRPAGHRYLARSSSASGREAEWNRGEPPLNEAVSFFGGGGTAMLKVFNDLTLQRQEFIPLEPGKVRMYVCGPTVYDYFHIGNARTFVVFDAIRRYLEYRGFEVTFVQNITDVEDKIIRRAAEWGVSPEELAHRYTEAYLEDSSALGIKPADIQPKATEHVGEIIAFIQRLVERGYAYVVDGDVYFDTRRFTTYGKLSHQSLEDLEAGARVEVDERKRHPADFALWKAKKPGEPGWDSPWGEGRPGWHIECSAMSTKYLGETIDIHAGGADLIFPHHENEIAQSEAASGKPFARYWLHGNLLNVGGQRMGKSLGNFVTVREARQQYDPEVIRFFLLSAHYRSPLNYTPESLDSARGALERLYNAAVTLEHLARPGRAEPADPEARQKAGELRARLPRYREQFVAAMDDDFNTADAIAALFDLVRDAHASLGPDAPAQVAGEVLGLLRELGGVLGLLGRAGGLGDLSDEIQSLIDKRQEARARRDWKDADRIRDELAARGIVLEDTPAGVRWKRKV